MRATVALGVLGCYVAVLSSFLLNSATSGQTTAPATQSAMREIRMEFVSAANGEPVKSMKGSYWPDQQTSGNSKLFTTDDHGQITFTLPADAKSVSFFYNPTNFVEGFMHLGGEGGGSLPDRYAMRLIAGLPIGGIVNDDQGKPVQGVKVQLSFTYRPAGSLTDVGAYGRGETDALGRWTFDSAPPNPTRIEVYTRHPDFVMKSFHHSFNGGQFENLRQKTLITVIKRGVTLAGKTVDESGNPVAKTVIAPDGLGTISETTGDDTGHFELHGLEPGLRHLLAKAEGYAPQIIDVNAEPDLEPITVRLEKGHVIRGRVLDSHGKPAAGVPVSVENWRTIPRLGVYFATDADGRFEWKDAPADQVTLSATQGGTYSHASATATAGEKEVVLTLPALVRVFGNVIDDVTGKPIDSFLVHVSGQQTRGGFSMDRPGKQGQYEVTSAEGADSYQVRVIAPGYLPLDSIELTAKDDEVRFDARLKTGGGIEGRVLQPDGKPAANADVILAEKGAASSENGVLSSWAKTANVSTTTDATGHFMLPPRTGTIKLMLSHATGWQFLHLDANSLDNLKLREWCTVEGVVMNGSKPWAGKTVTLRPTTLLGDHLVERQLFRYTAVTDSEGRFKLTRVVDGSSDIAIEIPVPMENGGNMYEASQRLSLGLLPGDHKVDVKLGGVGRPIIAHVLVGDDVRAKGLLPTYATLTLARPPGFIPPPVWDLMTEEQRLALRLQHEQTEESRRYAASVKEIVAVVQPNGTIRFDDVPAGQYTLHVSVLRRSPQDPSFLRAEASAQRDVTLEQIAGGQSDEPLDVGSVSLGETHRAAVGDMFPAIATMSFENKPLGLADFRGKIVLIDFWATWCGPCIAELKHIQRLQEQYANDPRFVILSLSVDDRPEEPKKFLATRNLPWPQAFAGAPAWNTLGIEAIPSLWLISADGKVIAKQIPEEQLDQAIKDALSTKP